MPLFTERLSIRTSAADRYNEVFWVDGDNGDAVLAGIVAHKDVHSGRSSAGGHLSIYVPDASDVDTRRSMIDIDFATAQNGYHPAIWVEGADICLRQGASGDIGRIFMQVSGTWYRLERRSDGVAVWTVKSPPEFP